mmetsp:Transcript_20119/g.43378  ORF Transcript_20119/g.43378 Transcript_20119/m.43378 type:complete len:361 (+) Transcript_20119:486-1568(+)
MAEEEVHPQYDKYDEENIKDAVCFLFDSVDEELQKQLYENCDEHPTFVSAWMNLMHIVNTVSMDRYEHIKQRLRNRTLRDYPRENIPKLCTDYLEDWKLLSGGRMYDHNQTMDMLKVVKTAGNHSYQAKFEAIRSDLSKFLMTIRHKSYEDRVKLKKKEYDVKSILKLAKEEYRIRLDDGEWPAATRAHDSPAMSSRYGQAHALQRTVGEPNNSTHSGRDKSNDVCNFCGKTGHWASECRKKERDTQGQSGNGRSGQGQSPDLNVLDLGFLNALQSFNDGAPNNNRELITCVEKALQDYPTHKLNRVFLTLKAVMNEIVDSHGANEYKLPHMNKERLEREGTLPLTLECSEDIWRHVIDA